MSKDYYEYTVRVPKGRFKIKTQCDCCGYQSMDIYPQDNRPCPFHDCNGSMIKYEPK